MRSTMHTRRVTSRTTAIRLAAAGVLAAVTVAGCEAGVVDEPTTTPVADEPQSPEPADTTTEPTTEEPTDTDEPTADPTDTDGPTEEPTDEPGDTDEGSGGEASGEVPPPGSEFEVGDTVTTHKQTSGVPDDQYYGYATLATTVTTVEEGDPELFSSAENAADFAGYTPWFVHVEHEWLTYEGTPNDNMIPALIAFNEDGGELSRVLNSAWSAGIPGCDLEMPDEKGVGEVATNCHVFAVPDGQGVGAVGWSGDDYADGASGRNPYWDDPVLWLVP